MAADTADMLGTDQRTHAARSDLWASQGEVPWAGAALVAELLVVSQLRCLDMYSAGHHSLVPASAGAALGTQTGMSGDCQRDFRVHQ